ncbi:substrate-binding periplasmic protein [Motiliproteus coralliicola]|nr:transporter substrate-binding domain-containing protein [Motiliproteus coralliicola]
MRGTLLALLLCWPAMLSAAESITIGVTDYPPFSNTDGDGLMSDIYRAAFAEVDIAVTIEVVPIPRGRLLFLNHNIDALSAGNLFVRPDERDQLLSVPVIKALPSLFFYMPHFDAPEKIVEVKDLRGFQVGIIVNSPLLPDYIEQGLNVVEIQTPEQLLMMVKKQRIDFFESALLTGLHLIQQQLPEERLHFDYLRWGVLESALAFHHRHPRAARLHQQFQQGLQRIRQSGELLAILENYWGKGNVPQAVFIQQHPVQGTEQFKMNNYWLNAHGRSGRIQQSRP